MQITTLTILILLFLTLVIQLYYLFRYHSALIGYKIKDVLQDIVHPVSVVISARNEEKNLRENLLSVLDQDYPDFEVIIQFLNDPSQADQDALTSWFGKLNNTFKLPKNFTLQLSGEYQSKTVLPPGGNGGGGGGRGGMFGGGGGGMFGQTTTSQGFVRSNYYVDAGLRYEFMKNKQASLSLNINDIFRTRRSYIFSESPFIVQDVFRRRDPQILRLNFNWRFGKFDASLFKRKNTKGTGGEGAEGMNMGQ